MQGNPDLERLKGDLKNSCDTVLKISIFTRFGKVWLKTKYVAPETISIFQLILIPVLSPDSLKIAGDKIT